MLPLLLACASTPDPPPAATVDSAACTPASVTAVKVTAREAPPGHRVTVSLDAPGEVAVACVADDDPADILLVEGASDVVLRLQGLRPEVPYTCAAMAACPAEAPEVFAVDGPARGRDLLPGATTTRHPTLAPTPGWLLTAWDGNGGCDLEQTLLILDGAGRVRWWFRQPEFAAIDVEARYHAPGEIVWGGNTVDGVHVVDLWDGLRWSGIRSPTPLYHHDAKRLGDGGILVLEHRDDTDGDATWRGYAVVVRDPETDAVRLSWESAQGRAQGVLRSAGDDDDPYHANWADLLPLSVGDRLLVSQCTDRRILVIEPESGTVEQVLGRVSGWVLQDADGTVLPDAEWPQCQHGVDLSGPDTLLLYDNGIDREESRVVELALDLDAGVATRTWEWTDGWFERTLGDVDPLGPDRVLVTQAHPECWNPTGALSRVVEVDRATGDVVWALAFDSPRAGIYRSEKIDPCAFPSVATCAAVADRWAALDDLRGALGMP